VIPILVNLSSIGITSPPAPLVVTLRHNLKVRIMKECPDPVDPIILLYRCVERPTRIGHLSGVENEKGVTSSLDKYQTSTVGLVIDYYVSLTNLDIRA